MLFRSVALRIKPFFPMLGEASGRIGDLQPRIRGGNDAFPGEHPWQASIRVRGKDKTFHWCGATIISHFHLVTAAHCLKDFPISSYIVRVGNSSIYIKLYKLTI